MMLSFPKHFFLQCIETCRWEYIANRSTAQCSAPFMPLADWPECAAYEPATDVMETYQEWFDPGSKTACREACVEPCTMNIYTAQVVKTSRIDSMQSEFHIYFASGETQVFTSSTLLGKKLFF